ncbi:hypothetical protein FHQ08_02365 [Lactobacillus sp. CC-MHH1034]|uniref:alpha-glucosyltransferase N-terminal domain-containing protein n=1 Tax=Agrilactobacillus fermenti TaxID=2586909 RepID=UPI001E29D79F|nr:alpha-glucosyltransferase N-terminal domain-containing protein [Agrilactobacillus fermenti]MCD2255556.1 hypothetical protein [Agrilactobacillus fermenti]
MALFGNTNSNQPQQDGRGSQNKRNVAPLQPNQPATQNYNQTNQQSTNTATKSGGLFGSRQFDASTTNAPQTSANSTQMNRYPNYYEDADSERPRVALPQQTPRVDNNAQAYDTTASNLNESPNMAQSRSMPAATQNSDAAVKPSANTVTNDNRTPIETAAETQSIGNYSDGQARSPWKQTQRNLVDLQGQESRLKDQLKQELLDQRSFLKHDLRQQGLTVINSPANTGDPAQKIQSQIDEVNDGLIKWFGTKKIANHVFFNKRRSYFLLDDSLNLNTDTIQKGVLMQLRKLFDDMQMPLGHISTDYNDQLSSVVKQLNTQGLMTRSTKVINKYQDLQEFNRNLAKQAKVDVPMTANMSTVHDPENNADKVYDQDQQLLMAIYYQNDHQIHVIEHFRDNTVISRDIFDANGAISATQYFDQVNSKRVIRENFYRTDGSLVLIKSYQDNEPYIQLLSRSNVLVSVFNSELELTLWWLTNKVFNGNTTILISVDSPLYQPLLALKNLTVEVIPVLSNYEEHTEIVDQLMNVQTPVDSILTTQNEAKAYIEKNTQHDVDISVLPKVDEDTNVTSGQTRF